MAFKKMKRILKLESRGPEWMIATTEDEKGQGKDNLLTKDLVAKALAVGEGNQALFVLEKLPHKKDGKLTWTIVDLQPVAPQTAPQTTPRTVTTGPSQQQTDSLSANVAYNNMAVIAEVAIKSACELVGKVSEKFEVKAFGSAALELAKALMLAARQHMEWQHLDEKQNAEARPQPAAKEPARPDGPGDAEISRLIAEAERSEADVPF